MVKVELFDCLDAVERDAAGALDRERQPNLFDRLSWYRLLQRHCPPAGDLLVARAQDERGGRSWLFLAVTNQRASAYANWYTLRFSSISDGECSSERNAAVARALRKRGIASVDLYPLRTPDNCRQTFHTSGWRSSVRPQSANWTADVAGLSFDEYWLQRPARLRNTFARKSRSTAFEISVFSDFHPDAWSDYEQVYRASWKPEEGSPAFLRALAEQEGAAGTLRLGIARRDQQPVAAQFWLVENGRATIHKLAYRADARAVSPGTVLSRAMFRYVIDTDRVDVIDFGLGDEPYKSEWMDRRDPVSRMTAFNPATLAGAAGALRQLVRRLRND